MANIHAEFIEFNKIIKLTNSKKEELKKNRKALRKKIRKYFREKKSDETAPKFRSQGSFEMNTTVNPIPVQDDETKLFKYDLDDGVYFIEDEDNRKSIQTYHNWIYNAVKGHAKDQVNKTTCIRVMRMGITLIYQSIIKSGIFLN